MRPAMGTLVAIEVDAHTESATNAIESAFAAIRRVESRMHPTRPGSDLAAIAAARIGEAVSVDPWTWELLRLARRIGALSGGVFDPCPPAESRGSLDELKLDYAGIVSRRAAICLDLGGIAKGFAVDKAIEELVAAGCAGGIVNAGGDLRVFGSPRTVLVRPARGAPIEQRLDNEALAVSDPRASSPPPEHVGYYLRGRTTPPLVRAAVVVAPSAAVADALTKCVLLAPATLHTEMLAQLGATAVDIDVP